MKDVALKSYETLNPMRHLTWRHRFTTPHLSMRILYLLRRMSKLREIRVFRVKNEQFPLATSSNVLVTVKIKQNKVVSKEKKKQDILTPKKIVI